jgi:hypothetical protein
MSHDGSTLRHDADYPAITLSDYPRSSGSSWFGDGLRGFSAIVPIVIHATPAHGSRDSIQFVGRGNGFTDTDPTGRAALDLRGAELRLQVCKAASRRCLLAAPAVVVGVEPVSVAARDSIHDTRPGVARSIAAPAVAVHVGWAIRDAWTISPGTARSGVR